MSSSSSSIVESSTTCLVDMARKICRHQACRSCNNARCVAMTFGGMLGGLVSFLVAATLLEVSINQWFAFYFGILFLFVGLAIGWRVLTSPGVARGARITLLILACVVFFAGVSCFVLDHRSKALGLSPTSRVPFYLVLGMAVSFSITFALVDCINLFRRSSTGKPMIENATQVALILCNACLTGLFYGLVFGLFDVEDSNPHVFNALLMDEWVSFPLGMGFGVVTGACVQRTAPPQASMGLSDMTAEQMFVSRMERAERGTDLGDDDMNEEEAVNLISFD